jgi:hypothetical protein
VQRASCSSCVVQMGFSGVVSRSIYSTQRAKVSKEVMNHRGSRVAGLYIAIRVTPETPHKLDIAITQSHSSWKLELYLYC